MFKLKNGAPSPAGSEKSNTDTVNERTPAHALELADEARDTHDIVRAAQLYAQPSRSGQTLWGYQRGHMLKEIGFYGFM